MKGVRTFLGCLALILGLVGLVHTAPIINTPATRAQAGTWVTYNSTFAIAGAVAGPES